MEFTCRIPRPNRLPSTARVARMHDPQPSDPMEIRLVCSGEGSAKLWILATPRPVQTIEIPKEVAAKMISAIINGTSRPMAHPVEVEMAVFEDLIRVRWEEPTTNFEMTEPQALSFAGRLWVLLRCSGT